MILKNKIVVISGVSKRFGEATAILFSREGANIVLLSRNEERINEVVAKIRNNNGNVMGIKCDVTNVDDVKNSLKNVISRYGKIDVLFSNVGGKYTKKQKMHEMGYNFWNEVIETNIKSIVILSKEVIPYMKDGGSIIYISAAYKTLLDSNTAYATVKSGIIGLTRNLARELIEQNIRVNCIQSGVIRNDFNFENLNKMPSIIKRMGNSEDIAYATLYLASDNSSWVTGQTLTIDGGEGLFK